MERLSFTRLLAMLAVVALFACSGGGGAAPFDPFDQPIPEPGNPLIPPEPGAGGGGGGVPTTPGGGGGGPTPPGTTTTQCLVPLDTNPPLGITLHIGFAENESKTSMQAIYSKFVALGSALWNVTEGQVYIYKVVLIDNVGAGTTPSQWEANTTIFSTSNLDIVVWPASSWDINGTLAVVWNTPFNNFGRVGRLMLAPSDVATGTLTHELGHLIWQLSWPQYHSLDDEYIDGVQDAACLMESENTPLRWCSASNHVNQASQPHSCWTQLLHDYTKLGHAGIDVASTSAWVPIAEYQDTP